MTEAKLKSVQLVLLDVDGVLTAGEIIYDDAGQQIKIFNVKDGIGIRLLKEAGIDVGIITGRSSEALRYRCQNLGIELLFDGVHHKDRVLDKISARTEIDKEAMAFVGDDLPDLPVMKCVGLAVAVGDAHEIVRQNAHIVTQAPGGHGAVREISEAILKAQGKWDALIERFLIGTADV
jgi:3-deoxy-D-manno-octulosonate 8-phosphate phosphatase (KDO 8-P phosphatase)